MEQHESCAAVTGITQNVFKLKGGAVGNAVKVAYANCAMDLHGKMQASGFADQVAEEVILEVRIFSLGGYPAMLIFRIDGFRDLLWRIVEMERAEVGDFELDSNAAPLFIVFNKACDEFQIVVKSRWKLLQPFLRQFISQLLFLQRNVDGQIPIAGDDCLVVERE